MRVAVLGNTPLGRAVEHACTQHHDTTPGPADILWVCDSREYVRPKPGQVIVLSWPSPVGTWRKWQDAYSNEVVVVMENVRAAHALDDFSEQSFIAVGIAEWSEHKTLIADLLAPFTKRVVFMSPESAEMCKHALNSLLALQVRFGNELGRVCEQVGADARDVVRALRLDRRVGDAYLMPGGEPGEHLMREVGRLRALGFRVAL